ncbi:MAG: universal stress protein [Chitinophagaceae bacterium]|nr:universal stress protein [Chitinophagaceae bacterium]
MKKVLIAIDYNPSSQIVAETGHSVAKAINAEIVLVHVISDATYYSMPYSPIMGYEGLLADNSILMADELRKEAGKFLAATTKHLNDENIVTRVLEGEVAGSILEYAKDNNVDLLILGSHSHSGLYKLFVGGVAEKLLQHSKIPLLIIPNKEEKVVAKES